jgi:hypothetical protein
MKEHRIMANTEDGIVERKLGENDIKITFGAIPDIESIE